MAEKPKRNYTSRPFNPKKPKVRIGAGRKYIPTVDRAEEPKDMHELELTVTNAFKHANSARDAAEMVMTIVKKNLLNRLNTITENTCGSHQVLMERLLVFKSQIK